jgi:cobalt-zinc-cadmium resistance protein CzcA
LKLHSYLDSIYKDFVDIAELKYKMGESSYLETISSKSQYQKLLLQKKQVKAEKVIYGQELQKLLNVPLPIVILDEKLPKLLIEKVIDTSDLIQNPLIAVQAQKISLAHSQLALEKNLLLPNLSFGYFTQSIDNLKGYNGFTVGIGIPLFFWGQSSKIQSAEIQVQIEQKIYENLYNDLRTILIQKLSEYQQYLDQVNYFENTGLEQAEELMRTSQLSYNNGEIGYIEYIQNLTQAVNLRTEYLYSISQLNQTVININYLINLL